MAWKRSSSVLLEQEYSPCFSFKVRRCGQGWFLCLVFL
jgi:hypothetical protein